MGQLTVITFGTRRKEAAFTRQNLVRTLRRKGIEDERVLAAVGRVRREEFVAGRLRQQAYRDQAQPIGYRQTISQPYVVALMTEALQLRPGARVLEIGTGSGYQTAMLAELQCTVYTVEIVPQLAKRAGAVLDRLGYNDIRRRVGDGRDGWGEHSPFDAIVVTAAPALTPANLLDQLGTPGRLIVPLGDQTSGQDLTLFVKGNDNTLTVDTLARVRFVPLITTPE